MAQFNSLTTQLRPWHVAGPTLAAVLCLLPPTSAAQEDMRRLERGTTIAVRTNQPIDADRADDRIYTGVVDEDVRDNRDRTVIPRGSKVELSVRVTRDNDLILDLESVIANDERYAVEANQKRVESRGNDDIIGAIVGAINGGEGRGRTVRVPRGSVVSFRLERALNVGVPDRGYDRDGWHYHGRDDRNDRGQRRDDDRRDRDPRRDDDRR
jgi:hypothetical protein